MASPKTCPHDAESHVTLFGDQSARAAAQRRAAAARVQPPEVGQVLAERTAGGGSRMTDKPLSPWRK